jgi:hypothetical protein
MNVLPSIARTGRWGFSGISKHFSGFEFILLSNIVYAHPAASKAHRGHIAIAYHL